MKWIVAVLALLSTFVVASGSRSVPLLDPCQNCKFGFCLDDPPELPDLNDNPPFPVGPVVAAWKQTPTGLYCLHMYTAYGVLLPYKTCDGATVDIIMICYWRLDILDEHCYSSANVPPDPQYAGHTIQVCNPPAGGAPPEPPSTGQWSYNCYAYALGFQPGGEVGSTMPPWTGGCPMGWEPVPAGHFGDADSRGCGRCDGRSYLRRGGGVWGSRTRGYQGDGL